MSRPLRSNFITLVLFSAFQFITAGFYSVSFASESRLHTGRGVADRLSSFVIIVNQSL